MAGSCEHGNDSSCSIKGWGNFYQLRDYQLLRKNSAPWDSLVIGSTEPLLYTKCKPNAICLIINSSLHKLLTWHETWRTPDEFRLCSVTSVIWSALSGIMARRVDCPPVCNLRCHSCLCFLSFGDRGTQFTVLVLHKTMARYIASRVQCVTPLH
jgi:hypothetical protein